MLLFSPTFDTKARQMKMKAYSDSPLHQNKSRGVRTTICLFTEGLCQFLDWDQSFPVVSAGCLLMSHVCTKHQIIHLKDDAIILFF